MGVRKFKPVTPGQRFRTIADFSDITKEEPEKSLVVHLVKHAGRNNQGKITTRHRGGGYKKAYRIIDFKRDKFGIPAKVASIEYDPNRSARIALLHYVDGEKRYIIAPLGLRNGDVVMSGEDAEVKVGNALPLSRIPVGTTVHNVELTPGRGGQLARSAGTYAQVVAKENRYAVLRLPSGEVRRVFLGCMATIGQVGNVEHENESIGKAGIRRLMGWRPAVRGSCTNPVDHPHGGGEGKTGPGGPPKTPWGKPALGYRTRKKSKPSSKFIIRRRK